MCGCDRMSGSHHGIIRAVSLATLVLLNKPFNVVSQFSHDEGVTLADYVDIKNVYPAGRLDKDSEGLLLLTDDGAWQHRISHPDKKMGKHYWVQVDKEVSASAIAQLRRGVMLKDGPSLATNVQRIDQPAGLWPRQPPIRIRKSIPTSWLQIELREGRNRQVRRMTAAVGFPTLRLIRYRIGDWQLDNLMPGEYRVEEV